MKITIIDGARTWSAAEVAALGVRLTSIDVLDDAKQALRRIGRQWSASSWHADRATVWLVPVEQPAPLGLSLTL